MDTSTYDALERTLTAGGPVAALDALIAQLREAKDYTSLFYALLMKKRHELGVSPLPTGPAQELPPETHAPYEQAIREASRLVGTLYLEQDNVPQAWVYFRMIGEPDAVHRALEGHRPAEGEDVHPLVQIAFYEGVHPRKGFDLILDRFGICNAITTLGSQELPHPPDVKQYCVQRLVRALYAELRERLLADIQRRGETAPEGASVKELMASRDWLFEDEFAHIDTSHLSAVVQMSTQLPPGEELQMARELCAYGARMPARLRYGSEPPFDDQYRDYGIYLATLAGDDVEAGIAHFRAKVEASDPEADGTFPAEVLVNLLLRLGRNAEALAVARKHLAGADARRLSCPGITELCQKAGDYRTLAEVARAQGDAVHFLAGLLAAQQGGR